MGRAREGLVPLKRGVQRRVCVVVVAAAVTGACQSGSEAGSLDDTAACDAYLSALYGRASKTREWTIAPDVAARFRSNCRARREEVGISVPDLRACAESIQVRSAAGRSMQPNFCSGACASSDSGGYELCDIAWCKSFTFVDADMTCGDKKGCRPGFECKQRCIQGASTCDQVCTRVGQAGDPCNDGLRGGTRQECAATLYCRMNERCEPYHDVGDVCDEQQGLRCIFGTACVEGRCALAIPLARDGETCALTSRSDTCSSESYCGGDTKCVPRTANGEACANERQCRQFSTCRNGKCQPIEEACRAP